MTFDGTCERGGVQRAPQGIEERSPAFSVLCALYPVRRSEVLGLKAQHPRRPVAPSAFACPPALVTAHAAYAVPLSAYGLWRTHRSPSAGCLDPCFLILLRRGTDVGAGAQAMCFHVVPATTSLVPGLPVAVASSLIPQAATGADSGQI
jgi:hypothetical protein